MTIMECPDTLPIEAIKETGHKAIGSEGILGPPLHFHSRFRCHTCTGLSKVRIKQRYKIRRKHIFI
jgi:hypothetical protein